MCGKPCTAVGAPRETFLKRGAEVCWAGSLHAQLRCQGGRIVDAVCFHTVHPSRLIKGVQSEVVSWPQTSAAAHSRDCRPQHGQRDSGLGTVHLRLRPDWAPFLGRTSGKEKLSPIPTSYRSREDLQNCWAALTTCRGHFHKRKTGKGRSKRPHFEFPTGRQSTLGPRALFH